MEEIEPSVHVMTNEQKKNKKESETINTLKKYIYGIFYNKAFDSDMPPNVIRLDLLCTDVPEGFCQGK